MIAIRDEAIRGSAALWIDEVPPRALAEAWFAEHLAAGSMLVAVDLGTTEPAATAASAADAVAPADRADAAAREGDVLGFASYGPLRPYDGYRLTAEDSVYLVDGAQGRGLGRALIEGLVARAEETGQHSLLGMIEAGNAASIALHARCGFTEVGRIPQAGLKFGRWLDLVIMQRIL